MPQTHICLSAEDKEKIQKIIGTDKRYVTFSDFVRTKIRQEAGE